MCIRDRAGILQPDAGQILVDGRDVTRLNARQMKELGVGFIPQDRHRHGLVLDMDIEDNLLMGYQRRPEYKKGRFLFNRSMAEKNAEEKIKDYDIRPADRKILTGKLSGGNQQKVVVARESSRATRVIIADQPSRGVDIGATELIYDIFARACKKGEGVMLSSLELDELLAATDRIMVVTEGRVAGIVESAHTSRREIGSLMVNFKENQEVEA